MNNKQTEVLFVDDHRGLRDSMASSLSLHDPEFVFLQASNRKEAESLLSSHSDCRTVLLDIMLGDENGLAVLESLRSIRPELNTLVLSALVKPAEIEEAIRHTIQGYITKDADIEEILSALKTVASGHQAFCGESADIMRAMLSDRASSPASTSPAAELLLKYKSLTSSEKEVFDSIAQGLSVRDITELRGRTKKTVENQRTSAFEKMGIHDRHEAIETGKLLGIVQ